MTYTTRVIITIILSWSAVVAVFIWTWHKIYMGWHKWNKPRSKENKENEEDEQVKCDECKHWVDKDDANKVVIISTYGNWDKWYCPMHKKPYHKMVALRGITYYGEVEMTKDGTPVGYTKLSPPPRLQRTHK